MDPDAVLAEIRELIETPNGYDDYDRLVWLFTGLDEWLYKGGLLPHDWKRRNG